MEEPVDTAPTWHIPEVSNVGRVAADVLPMDDPAGTVESLEAELPDRLSEEEDDEIRRLNYLAQQGSLSPWSRERLLELRLGDRRKEIRPPREFEKEAEARPQQQVGFEKEAETTPQGQGRGLRSLRRFFRN